MAMIGSKEIVCDTLLLKIACGKMMPHPLTVASLEMMRATITPQLDRVESITHFAMEYLLPHVLYEEIIILIHGLNVTHPIHILTLPLTSVIQKLENEDKVLNYIGVRIRIRVRITVSNIRILIDGTEVHQY